MPNVSDEFIKSAAKLAEYVKNSANEKQAEDKTPQVSDNVKTSAAVVAETLVTQGLIAENEKEAAVASLTDHEQALLALNKIAQAKMAAPKQTAPATSMGAPAQPEKKAAFDHRGEPLRESDRKLFQALGISV